MSDALQIRSAVISDCPAILTFIQALADYEKLAHEAVATVADLEKTLFGAKPAAKVLIAEWEQQPAGFALYFYSYSTFLGKPGLYLEDLFVHPQFRGKRIGLNLMRRLARIALENDCGRFEWSVLDWNQPAIDFYRSIGALPMDGWTVQRVTGEALTKLADG